MTNMPCLQHERNGLTPGMSATVAWFIPATVCSDADPDTLRRARQTVTFGLAIVCAGVFYTAVLIWMNIALPALIVATGTTVVLAGLLVMRWTGRIVPAANIVIAGLFGVLTVLPSRMGGHGAAPLFWYAAVPLIAMSIVGKRSACAWSGLAALSLCAFYALASAGYAVPNDLSRTQYDLYELIVSLGLVAVVLALTSLYEFHKNQALSQVRESEEALRSQRDFAQAVVETAQCIVLVLDVNGRIVRFNRFMEETSGYQLEEVQGKDWFTTLLPQRDHQRMRALFDQAKGGAPTNGNANPIVTKDGHEREIEWYDRTLRDSSGEIVGLLAVGQDITERMRAEERSRLTQFAVDRAPEAVFWLGPDARFVYVNDASTRLLGYSRDELLSMRVPDVCPRHSEDAWPDHWREIEKRGSFTFETDLRQKDGQCREAEITVNLVEFEGKKVNCAFVRDVSELKRAKDALQEERNKLRSVVDAMDGMDTMLTIQDWDYNIIYQNGAMERTFGGLGGKCYKVYEGNDTVCQGCPVKQAFADGQSHTAERAVPQPGGKTVYFDNTAHPVRNAAGEITSCVEVVRNITDRKLAEKTLRESEQKHRTLFESSRDALLILDPDVGYIDCNSAAVELFGASSKEELLSLAPPQLSPEYQPDGSHSAELAREKIEKSLRDGSHSWDWTYKRLDGREFFGDVLATKMNWGGKVVLQGTIRDITERVEAEKARQLALERQQKLTDLQRALLGPGELPAKLKLITDGVVEIFDADFCRIWITQSGDLCDSGCMHAEVKEGPHVCRYRDRCLRLMASSGRYTHIDGEVHRRVPFGCYKIGRVAAGDDPKFLTNEAQADPRVHNHEWTKELGLVSFAGYQLRPPGGDTIGVLALFAKHKITPKEDALLESLGSTAVQMIQKARAEDEAIQQNRFLTSVLESLNHPFMVLHAHNYSVLMANTAARRCGPPNAKTCHGVSHHRDTPCDSAEHVCPLNEVKRTGRPVTVEHLHRAPDGSPQPVEVHSHPIFDENGQVVHVIEYSLDITDRKRAQARLEAMQQKLIESSRKAGMAEVATGVLHNVGNVLNSVNVSASVVVDKVRRSKAQGLTKVAELVGQHTQDLGKFITEDEHGKHLPRFLATLAETIASEQTVMLEELQSLTKNIDHIKTIVATQQSYAGASGLVESTSLNDLLEDALALRMGESSFERHAVHVDQDIADLPPIEVDKQKLLQVLINLIRNAKHSVVERGQDDRRLTLRAAIANGDRVRIEVADNGMGIAPENLTRIFAHGFTTKQTKGGRGFGLHHSALIAKEMGGSLTADSDGPGKGATFTLELPLRVTNAHERKSHRRPEVGAAHP